MQDDLEAQIEAAGFDPRKPFVAEDLYEYEDLAAYLQGKPKDSPRNTHVKRLSHTKRSRAFIQFFVFHYENSIKEDEAARHVEAYGSAHRDEALTGGKFPSRAIAARC
jgi:hypothetical protein